MTDVGRVLRNQIRGMTGGLIVAGGTILFTMEAWWLGWQRPASHLIAYAVLGLGVVLLITRSSGFRVEEEEREGGEDEAGEGREKEENDGGGVEAGSHEDASQYDPLRLAADFAELVLQSFVAAYVVLFVYGVVTFSTPLHVVARTGLLQVVPLGFGAALSNRLLVETEEEEEESAEEQTLGQNLAVFAAGAVFFSLALGAEVEMNVLPAKAGWPRLGAVVALSLVTAYLILYELEFRGQSRRTADHERAALLHAGQTCVVYVVAVAMSALLLWGFDSLKLSLAVDVQKVIVLSFPSTVGAAAARVIL